MGGVYQRPSLTFSLPKDPAVFDLQPATYHRVQNNQANRNYPANSFNPYYNFTIDASGCLRDPNNNVVSGTRFAPIVNAQGNIIPTLYLASTDRAAYAEILVRAKSQKQITLANISTLERVTIEVSASLSLLNVAPPYINSTTSNVYGISDAQLLYSTERYYPETCRFASQVHAAYPDIQGIHWLSRQENNHSVYVLFGDRVHDGCLSVKSAFEALSLSELRIWLPDAARYGAKVDDDLLQHLSQVLPDISPYL